MESLLAHCSHFFSSLVGQGGIFVVFFLGGLTGGFTHCLTMCGPVAAAGAACSGGCASSCGGKRDLSRVFALSYHLGRITTYGALGFAAALLSKQVAGYSFWPILSAIMLSMAGIMFLLSSLQVCRHSLFSVSRKNNYISGILLGFMPCGLLYAALMTAATLANPWGGMAAMWLFAVGTVPALLIAAGGVDFLSRKRQSLMNSAGRVMMAFNGISLLVIATRVMR